MQETRGRNFLNVSIAYDCLHLNPGSAGGIPSYMPIIDSPSCASQFETLETHPVYVTWLKIV